MEKSSESVGLLFFGLSSPGTILLNKRKGAGLKREDSSSRLNTAYNIL